MIRRPPRSTRTDTLFPTRRSSDLRQQWALRRSHLVHGDEHASSGRTSSDGGNHRRRSGRMAASSRERRTVTQAARSEEHTSELQSLMRLSYAVFCLQKKKQTMRIKTRTSLTNQQATEPLHN